MKLTHSFVMCEKMNGRFLYVAEEKHLYSAANNTAKGTRYRCVEREKYKCQARIFLNTEGTECYHWPNDKAHSHEEHSEERYVRLMGMQAIKTDLQSVQNIASGSRMKRPREVWKSATVK